jgi:formylglycine-generating enzyme required for sulfatase activity
MALCGCGEQDLYDPPTSPYSVLAVLPMESAPQDVSVLGDVAFVACGQAGLLAVDLSDPAFPVVVSTVDTKKFAESIVVASVPSPEGVSDIAFVVEGTEGITTYDISDPDSVVSYEQGTTAVDGNGLFLALPDNPADPYVVYLAENWKGLRVFESDPNVPGLLRYNGVFSYTRGYAKSLVVQDGHAYVADDEMGLAVLDVSVLVLGEVKVVTACDSPGNAQGVALANGHAFLADGENGLVVMKIEGAEEPVPVGHLELAGDCRDIEIRDETAFIAAEDGGLHTVDISVPTEPRLLGSVVTTYAQGVSLSTSGIVAVADRDDGLVVLGGPGPFRDVTPPARVGDLAAIPEDSTSIRLEWRAPGNDGLTGTADQYDIRYAGEVITEANWADAMQAEGEPAPSRSGAEETFLVTGLTPDTEYYFAVRTADAADNWSGLSNVATAMTPLGNVPPRLQNLSVTPPAGDPGTLFRFETTYSDGDGDIPTRADVVIDDEPHAMTFVSGDHESGALYRYETTLAEGAHEHYYSFDDGHDHQIITRIIPGPGVGEAFEMGSPAGEPGRDVDETLHTVVLTYDFEVSDHEVTQTEYEEVMGTNPSRIQGPDLPVENVTWFDAVTYCNERSSREGLTPAYTIDGQTVTWNREANGYRLPTEAEWEYTCRAGSSTAFATGPITREQCGLDPVLDAIGWYCGNSEDTTHDVMTKQANSSGHFDMHGNVWEWCWDWYREDLGPEISVDPAGPAGGSQRVIRGGSWFHFARECRSASRAPYWPNSGDDIVGFRVARTVR